MRPKKEQMTTGAVAVYDRPMAPPIKRRKYKDFDVSSEVFNKFAKTLAERENISDPDEVMKEYKDKILKLYMGVSAYFNHQYRKDANQYPTTTSGFFNLI